MFLHLGITSCDYDGNTCHSFFLQIVIFTYKLSDLNSEKMTHLRKSILLHIKATHIMNFDQKGVKCWIHESYLFFVVTEMPQSRTGLRIRGHEFLKKVRVLSGLPPRFRDSWLSDILWLANEVPWLIGNAIELLFELSGFLIRWRNKRRI